MPVFLFRTRFSLLGFLFQKKSQRVVGGAGASLFELPETASIDYATFSSTMREIGKFKQKMEEIATVNLIETERYVLYQCQKNKCRYTTHARIELI